MGRRMLMRIEVPYQLILCMCQASGQNTVCVYEVL